MKQNLHAAAAALGRLGGKAGTGAAKARHVTSAQARKAALARWSKHTLPTPLDKLRKPRTP